MVQVNELHGLSPLEMFSVARTEPLTEGQIDQVRAILTRYNPEDFANADRSAMRKEMRMAGIPPTRELFQLIEDAGFDRPPVAVKKEKSETSPGIENPHAALMGLQEAFRLGKISDEQFRIEVELVKDRLGDAVGEMIDHTIG